MLGRLRATHAGEPAFAGYSHQSNGWIMRAERYLDTLENEITSSIQHEERQWDAGQVAPTLMCSQ